MTTTLSHQLDIRSIPPKERHPQILEAFAALGEGADFVLISDHDPRPLLYQFQAEHPSRFDWSPLEEGPEVWRIRIHRRAQGSAPGRGVNEYMAWDHDRLDAILVETCAALSRGAVEESRRLFGEFRTGLLRHIRMEEEVLFPAFEQATGMFGGGPTAVMRMEHREIEKILESMRVCLESSGVTPDRFEPLRQSLLAVLVDHNAKEEHVVYPMTDHHHTPQARDGIVRKMQLV
jgi:regulator of cell morphogenesis and NO signaling